MRMGSGDTSVDRSARAASMCPTMAPAAAGGMEWVATNPCTTAHASAQGPGRSGAHGIPAVGGSAGVCRLGQNVQMFWFIKYIIFVASMILHQTGWQPKFGELGTNAICHALLTLLCFQMLDTFQIFFERNWLYFDRIQTAIVIRHELENSGKLKDGHETHLRPTHRFGLIAEIIYVPT